MSNIINNNLHNLKLRVSYDEYWDFFLNKDSYIPFSFDSNKLYDDCLISYIDAELDECVVDNWLYGTNKYLWEYANSVNHTLYNIGYTGIDNGLIPFRRDLHNNRSFFELYTKSTLDFFYNDIILKLHQVSGGTNLYEYPITVEKNRIKLNGGFYQGFFKTECDKYQILPSNPLNGETWHFEFVLNKQDFEKESNKTLNDKYPNNKGIFFYIGTRAENKWAYLYNKDDECFTLSSGDYVENGEIEKKDYKITNMLDANPVFIDYGEFAMNEFLSFKYYQNSLYEPSEIKEDDFFGDDYIMVDEKPEIIDEKNNYATHITWCCGDSREENDSKITYDVCCEFDNILLSNDNTVSSKNGYLSGCDLFGDDYILDIDDIEYGGNYIEEDLDISDFDFKTDGGLSLNSNQYFVDIDNKFLLFDRTCDGYDVNNWVEGTIGRYIGKNSSFKENLFLLMNRTCTGYDATNIDEIRDKAVKEYNIYNDIYNNALAFRITDDGEIGYRYITVDCNTETQTTIKESYSNKGIIKDKEWVVINVKITFSDKKMKIKFYVNGKLIFVSDELDKLDLRPLKEAMEKQETVPFNISLGGGTQGLAETILPNYMLDPYRLYPIEENFAGTFIGYLKSFKFYNCLEEYMNINNNFKYEMDKLIHLNIY